MRLKVIRFLRLHFIIAIQFLIIFSTKGVGGARKRGGRYTVMAKKMDLGALRQQILELQIDKELKHDLLEVINEKKYYGLVWEGSSEAAWNDMQDQLPVFVEDTTKRLDTAPEGSPNHVLIEGDNLNALAALTYAYAGKIDVIYIDPPYNTGSKDFVYNDSFVDKEDGYRHSKWLSFMDRRLKLAKKLLSEKGVIFISIGSDEIAQLTLLCNKLFGEYNQIAIIPRVQKKGNGKGTHFSPAVDYVLAYCNYKQNVDRFFAPNTSDFPMLETEGKRAGEYYECTKSLYQGSLDSRPNQRYYIECPDHSFIIPPGNVFPDEVKDAAFVKPLGNDDKCWRWSWDSYLKQKHLLVFKKVKKATLLDEFGKPSKWNVYTKRYQKDAEEKGKVPPNYIDDCINSLGTARLAELGIDFPFSKPCELVKKLVKYTNKDKDITIVDFFAGSGTSMDAMMQLNVEDGGHRKCILVQGIEKDDDGNDKRICEKATYERNKRVINGYTNQKGEEVPGLTHNNLRYYKTEFVPRDQSSSKSRRALMASLVDLLCIKNNIYQEQETFVGKKFKKSVLRYFKDEAGQMLVVLDERVVSIVIPMIAEVATKQNPLKVYVYSDGAYAYEDEFHKVMPVIELCAMPDAFLQALEGRTDILPKRKYSDAMMKEFQQNEELAMHNEEVVKEALSDDYDYVSKEKEDNVTNDIID